MSQSTTPHLTPPAVDDRLIAPESRFEVIDGRLAHVPPAHEPHGTRHSELCALLEAHVAEGYDVACDMLTRTGELSDIAPDASVFPIARDAATGGRQLEEIAFEILSTERLAHAAHKARLLAERGVRRVFAIDVERKRALTWSTATSAWEILPPSGAIEDRAFAVPLPIDALAGAARADDAMARALVGKKHPVVQSAIAEGEARGRREGAAEGKREGKREGKLEGKLEGRIESSIEKVLTVLRERGVELHPTVLRKLQQCADEATLDAIFLRALRGASGHDLFE